MGNSTPATMTILNIADIDRLPKSRMYSAVTAGMGNPFAGTGINGSSSPGYFMTPRNRFIAVVDHEPAAAAILGATYDPDDSWMDRHSSTLAAKGWVRIVIHDKEIYFTNRPSASQLRELKNLAIENHMTLIDANGSAGDAKVLYSPDETQAANEDSIGMTTTAINTADLFPLGHGTVRRRRSSSLRESGLPHRKTNPRRIIAREARREERIRLLSMSCPSPSSSSLAEGKGIISVAELDAEFLTRAENNPSLNLTVPDFQVIKGRKAEIQYLIKKHFFPEFDLKNTIEDTVIRKDAVNRIIGMLKKENELAFEMIYGFRPVGIGPGEALIYFIYDKAVLGGGAKACDVEIGSNEYEIKAVKVKGNGDIYDFKLGGTVPLADVMKELTTLSGKAREISGADIAALKATKAKEFKAIETQFAKIAYDSYFSKHDVIFFNHGGSAEYGTIAAVGRIKPENIFIERVTAGTIKPLIRLSGAAASTS